MSSIPSIYNTLDEDGSRKTMMEHCEQLLNDYQRERHSRTGHVSYYFICGRLDNPENVSLLNPSDLEVSIKNLKWSKADKYIPFFSESLLDCYYECKLTLADIRNSIIRIDEEFGFPDYEMSSCQFKRSKKFSADEVKIFRYCLLFYTGLKSETNNRTLAYDIKAAFIYKDNSTHLSHDLFLINSGIIKAIRALPLFWGQCVRAVDLTDEDIQEYRVGTAVTWIQFCSSTEGARPIGNFSKRNTYFLIESISGRKISRYSRFPDENEVIFLPYSHFLVYKTKKQQGKNFIYLKQIELGIGKSNILWVDDEIFNSSGENKRIMEKIMKMNPHIKVIPKETSESALAYLDSDWGSLKKNELGTFRILTDLKRPNEIDGNRAGARFLWEVLNRGFRCEMMIFTSNSPMAQQALKDYFLVDFNIRITEFQKEALNFMSFSDNILN